MINFALIWITICFTFLMIITVVRDTSRKEIKANAGKYRNAFTYSAAFSIILHLVFEIVRYYCK